MRTTPKLVAPHANRIVRRPRVITAIDRALSGGICWIAAPAGYGKTTAMLDYLHKQGDSHLWYRVDEGDQDIASFFHHLDALAKGSHRLPVFGPEYADQPETFARRFFRAWFDRLSDTRLLVIDDLHYAEVAQFRAVLTILLRELPDGLRCACISRTLPPEELIELTFKGRLAVLDQSILQFSDQEARTLVASRLRKRSAELDVLEARGWAAGLVLMADRAAAGDLRASMSPHEDSRAHRTEVFTALARQLFGALTPQEQEAMLKLSLLPDITPELARELTGSEAAPALLTRLHQRQLLVTRSEGARNSYHLHDLLRDFLQSQIGEYFPPQELATLRERTAMRLNDVGYPDAAIELALQAQAWALARRLIVEHADPLIAQGRRATLIDWCNSLPQDQLDAWICYWLGVAHMADDATAELWLTRAWSLFTAQNELDGQCLTAARAVLSKSDSWRTHEGLAAWTQRVIDLIDRDFPLLSDGDQLLVWAGMQRAVDFGQDYRSDSPAARRLTLRLLERLAVRAPADTPNLRLMASQTLIDHAGSTGQSEIFERAVDSVKDDLRAPDVTPWVLGVWLVTFGSVTSRYFSYSKRGFPYPSPEQALRAAVAIGEREGLRGVEFGALYHLQLLMKMHNAWPEFGTLIARIAEISDSRYTTQVAVAADCQAALHTRQKRWDEAYRSCERFMHAIEAANEPPLERWPHFITKFQVLLADGKPDEAAAFLEGLIGLFDGALRQRTQVCVLIAHAFAAKWATAPHESGEYPQRLQTCLGALRVADWTAALINLPDHIAELCADALSLEIEPALCNTLIRRRVLSPPASRPRLWPWAVRIGVLGKFRLEINGEPANTGAKAPTRSLDLLRILAVTKDHTCSLQDVYDWLWPDADGDQAKAACEQALHRLRKLLAVPEAIVQREGKLQLSDQHVWVDLDDWEGSLAQALCTTECDDAGRQMQRVFDEFPGPLFHLERTGPWALLATERVRGKFVDLAGRLARHRDEGGDAAAARAIYLRAIDMYPTSAGCYEGLIRNRLADQDKAGALEDYERYLRVTQASPEGSASPAIRALVDELLR